MDNGNKPVRGDKERRERIGGRKKKMKEKEEKKEGRRNSKRQVGQKGRGKLALTHAFMVPPTSQYWYPSSLLPLPLLLSPPSTSLCQVALNKKYSLFSCLLCSSLCLRCQEQWNYQGKACLTPGLAGLTHLRMLFTLRLGCRAC